MLLFLKKHVIKIAIVTVFILILIGATFSYYNRVTMQRALVTKNQSEAVLKQIDRLQEHIRLMDISSRGYALIRKPQFLFWKVADAHNRNKEIFGKLDSLFALQKVSDPTYDKIKPAMEDYTTVFASMVASLESNNQEEYIKMLEYDYGKIFYVNFEPFFASIGKFEAGLADKAQEEYSGAVNRNTFVQFLLVLIGLPTLVWVLYKITKDDTARTALLLDLEENNKKYLFNDGQESNRDVKKILQKSIAHLQRASAFVNEISEGHYQVQWESLNKENQHLNKSNLAGRLVYMRDEMKRVKEEDNRRIWITQGLSEFSDMIRKYQSSMDGLTFNALTYLVKYTGSQQGSIFVVQDDGNGEPYLQLNACYAFEKRKFIEKRVSIGEGLIGQTYLEGTSLLLKTVPANYISITSGLGHATPSCVLIVPLKHNEEVQAMLELASFEEYKPYQVSFLEKAGEFIASAISTAQQTEKNKILMDQMQSQTEQMRAQEEELRQNLEELEATQEAMRRKGVDEERMRWERK